MSLRLTWRLVVPPFAIALIKKFGAESIVGFKHKVCAMPTLKINCLSFHLARLQHYPAATRYEFAKRKSVKREVTYYFAEHLRFKIRLEF